MNLIAKIRKKGLRESFRIALERFAVRPYYRFKHRNRAVYANPTPEQLVEIEHGLSDLGLDVIPLVMSRDAFEAFQRNIRFPLDYHGGVRGGVWDEKLLEHFIAWELCRLGEFSETDTYIDIAGCGSPWARLLREKSIHAFSVDLHVHEAIADLDYYLEADAKHLPFEDGSVRACSLQCAFEMFNEDDDWLFLGECRRILEPGGVVVIVPLYMHTHHCGYATPEFLDKGFADAGAAQYVSFATWEVPFSRKYSPELLKKRIVDYAGGLGMDAELYKLENGRDLGTGIYCHFILVLRNGG